MAKLGTRLGRQHAGAREPERGLGRSCTRCSPTWRRAPRRTPAISAASPARRSRRCKSLGQASVTGKQAVQAATPTVAMLNKFGRSPCPGARPEPGDRAGRASTPRTTRSSPIRAAPAARDSAVCEALLQYVFNQTLASTRSVRSGTCWRSTPSSARCARRTRRRRRSRRTSSTYGAGLPAVLLVATGPTSRASTRPTRLTRAPACPTRVARRRARPGPKTTAAACPAEALTSTRRAPRPARSKSSSSGDRPSGHHQLDHRGSPYPADDARRPERTRRACSGRSPRAVGTRDSAEPRSTMPTTPSPPSRSRAHAGWQRPSAQQAQQLLNYLLSP